MTEAPIIVGRVMSPHGVKGEMKVEPMTDFPERFAVGSVLFLPDGTSLVIETARPSAKGLIVSFAGYCSRDAASRLTGAFLSLPRAEAGELPEGSYYAFQLEGCRVLDSDGEQLGVVSELESGPGQDRLVVAKPQGGEFRVPFVAAFILSVRAEEALITIKTIPGLTDG